MKKYIYVASCCILFATSGCTSLQERLAIRKCKFALVQVEVQKFTFSDITLGLHIAITNPNTIDVKIDKMDFALYIENKKTINGSLNPVVIPSKNIKTVVASLVVPFSIIGMTIIEDVQNRSKIIYQLVGTVYINTRSGVLSFPVTISSND